NRLIDLLQTSGQVTEPRDLLLARSLADLVARGAAVSPALEAQMWDLIREAELQGLSRATLAPGAVDVLRELRRRDHGIALLTNTSRSGLMDRLHAWGLAPYFDVIATRDDVPALKPHPDGLAYVLSHLPPVRTAYLVGDAWIDAQAAREANIRFIGIGGKRATIEARGLPIWAWIAELGDLLSLEVSAP
ncbi:MAG TPA: HAD-IA family hydrolase, partial [bacterium]|nr:HAD-IA family hydrolase [bacterium]